jgi:hypothetical protein
LFAALELAVFASIMSFTRRLLLLAGAGGVPGFG